MIFSISQAIICIMFKTQITYFTGTGNTWFLADCISNELRKHRIQVTMTALEQTDTLNPASFDLLGIGFPVYAGCFPYNVWRFARSLKPAAGKKTFVFSTKAQATAGSEALLGRLLAQKGYKVLAARSFLAPNNETLLLGPEDISLPDVSGKLKLLKAKVPGFVDEVLSGKGVIPKDNTFMLISSLLSGFSFYANSDLPTNLRIKGNCTRCGFCERICPAGNIVSSLTSPRFRNRCIICERCVSFCPEKVIVHPVTFVRTSLRYRAPGYKPPILRKATR